MKERIILAPGANGSELIKSLALHGVNTFNLRIVGSTGLARLALLRSGISVSANYIDSKEEISIISNLIQDEEYFGKTTYSDVQEIARAIRTVRTLVKEKDEDDQIHTILKQGLFEEKNEALLRTYDKYMAYLKDNNCMDAMGLIRLAAFETKPVNADFITLQEYPLSPLERVLVNNLSTNTVKEMRICELFNTEYKQLEIDSIKNCYGASNEVESIIDSVYRNKKIDQCTVALTDPNTYNQLFFDYSLLYDLPVTFGCGIPIINSNPGRLLSLYSQWISGGFFSKTTLKAMLFSNVFNRKKLKESLPEVDDDFSWNYFYKVLERLRLTNVRVINQERLDNFKKAVYEEEKIASDDGNKDTNKKISCIPVLEAISEEFCLNTEDFIKKYVYIRKKNDTNTNKLILKLDYAALGTIYDELNAVRMSGGNQNDYDIILNILKMNTCKESSEPGKLHITDIKGAMSTIRKHMFIGGLSASKYPGSPRENYLLLDEDYKCFGDEAIYLTSEGRINYKKSILQNLVRLSSSLESKVYLSYSGLNVADLKKDNASSMLFELFAEAKGKNVTSKELEEFIQKVEYFSPAISKTREVGKKYVSGYITDPILPHIDHHDEPAGTDKEFSPTEIETFYRCPYLYMYQYILGIGGIEEEDPFTVISSIDVGNLAHLMMEKKANTTMSKEEFLGMCEAYFDRFMAQNPPLIKENLNAEKDSYMEMMENAYDADPNREVVLKEEAIHAEHECGIKIFGYPDRVEKLDDGTYMVVDYKTGRKIKHISNDVSSCLQVMIYAYLMEKQGYKVTKCEYRYIRMGEVISCNYSDSEKRSLNEKLNWFRSVMQMGMDEAMYDATSEECPNCSYRLACNRI